MVPPLLLKPRLLPDSQTLVMNFTHDSSISHAPIMSPLSSLSVISAVGVTRPLFTSVQIHVMLCPGVV